MVINEFIATSCDGFTHEVNDPTQVEQDNYRKGINRKGINRNATVINLLPFATNSNVTDNQCRCEEGYFTSYFTVQALKTLSSMGTHKRAFPKPLFPNPIPFPGFPWEGNKVCASIPEAPFALQGDLLLLENSGHWEHVPSMLLVLHSIMDIYII